VAGNQEACWFETPNSLKKRGSKILYSCSNRNTSCQTNEISHVSIDWLPLYVVTRIFGITGSRPFSENFSRNSAS